MNCRALGLLVLLSLRAISIVEPADCIKCGAQQLLCFLRHFF